MNVLLARNASRLVIFAVFVGYVILAVELARVRPPNSDNGNFANAAVIFANKGYLAMPMMNGVWLPGVDKCLYAQMPLYFLLLAAWFKAFGVGIITMRLLSVLWGAVALGAWYVIMRVLSQNRRIALLSLVLIGLNYDYAHLTADRYDIMCAALNACALAAYLSLRERHFEWALTVSNILAAAAFLTHPYGFFGFIGLALFVIGLDRDRFRWRELLISAAPYVAALAAWGSYIAHNPDIFRKQFFGNVAMRLPRFEPIGDLRAEIAQRYLALMAGWRPDVPVYMRLKTLILGAILAGIIGCLVAREVRQNRNYRLLLILTAVWFLVLAYLEPTKAYYFVVHILPAYFALLAVWLSTLIKRGGLLRYFAGVCVGLLVVFASVSVAYQVRLNRYQKAFLPAMVFLQQRVAGNELVIGPGEFGVELGFERHVLADIRFGYGIERQPDYVVSDSEFEGWQATLFPKDSPIGAHIQNILKTYRLVFASSAGYDFYRVYARPQ